jgi:hypothetical protein
MLSQNLWQSTQGAASIVADGILSTGEFGMMLSDDISDLPLMNANEPTMEITLRHCSIRRRLPPSTVTPTAASVRVRSKTAWLFGITFHRPLGSFPAAIMRAF